ncbi:hypothetical protein [Citrobacter portucalensis]|uniref:hypothetical protein n=1 Tax=Citrobacter portucalensis TaxID=1639133 RepID=UPI0023AF83E9|nr:hypothetical protein [Citrobacter portucalensis]MDT7466853.1 hypothetical protein [Citrobacter portucalensis]WII76850.1 hypothetical protein N5860_00970 [Citrobacter portucalensis]
MEYVTESLTVSGKWCTIFADKMKVKHGVGKTKNTPCQRFACRPDKALAPPSGSVCYSVMFCLMALRLSGLQKPQMQKARSESGLF